jgi:hypothetical protein
MITLSTVILFFIDNPIIDKTVVSGSTYRQNYCYLQSGRALITSLGTLMILLYRKKYPFSSSARQHISATSVIKQIPRGSDDGVYYSELLDIWNLSIVQFLESRMMDKVQKTSNSDFSH